MSGAYKMSLFTSALQPDPEYFSGWSDSEKSTLALAAKGELRPFCEVVKARLDASGAELAYMYAILHDRDTASDHIASLVDGGFVAPHIHLLVGFKSKKTGLTPARAAAALGVQPQMIEKAKPGRYTPDNCLAYLIHAKDADKHHYDAHDVVTVIGEDYRAIEAARRQSWAQGEAFKSRKSAQERLPLVLEKAARGEISKRDILENDDFFETYATIPGATKAIDTALSAAAERRNMSEAKKLDEGEFTKSVFFFDGPSGTGKSLIASALADCLQYSYDWDSYPAAAKNALDDYLAEQVIVMDDVRGGAMSFEDWLRLLDPHHASPASARYKNKQSIAPRVVIITSSMSPDSFFFRARSVGENGQQENLDQPIRRILRRVRILDPFGPNGWLNCDLMGPVHHSQPSQWPPSRYWWHESVREDHLLSPFDLLSELMHAVNSRNRDKQVSAEQLQAAIECACNRLASQLGKAADEGDLPPLPAAICPHQPDSHPCSPLA